MENELKENFTLDKEIEELSAFIESLTSEKGLLTEITNTYSALQTDLTDLVSRYNNLEQQLSKAAIDSKKYPNAKAIPVEGITLENLELDTEIAIPKMTYKGAQELYEHYKEKHGQPLAILLVLIGLLAGFLASYTDTLAYKKLAAARIKDVEDLKPLTDSMDKVIAQMSKIIADFLNNTIYQEFYLNNKTVITPQQVSIALVDHIDKKAKNTKKRHFGLESHEVTLARGRRDALLELTSKNTLLTTLEFITNLLPANISSAARADENASHVNKYNLGKLTQTVSAEMLTEFKSEFASCQNKNEVSELITRSRANISDSRLLSDPQKEELLGLINQHVEANKDALFTKIDQEAQQRKANLDLENAMYNQFKSRWQDESITVEVNKDGLLNAHREKFPHLNIQQFLKFVIYFNEEDDVFSSFPNHTVPAKELLEDNSLEQLLESDRPHIVNAPEVPNITQKTQSGVHELQPPKHIVNTVRRVAFNMLILLGTYQVGHWALGIGKTAEGATQKATAGEMASQPESPSITPEPEQNPQTVDPRLKGPEVKNDLPDKVTEEMEIIDGNMQITGLTGEKTIQNGDSIVFTHSNGGRYSISRAELASVYKSGGGNLTLKKVN